VGGRNGGGGGEGKEGGGECEGNGGGATEGGGLRRAGKAEGEITVLRKGWG